MDVLPAKLLDRALALVANVCIFYAVYLFATNQPLPNGGLESVWLFSAIAFWFFRLLSSPWFVPPRDALANAVGANAFLVTMDLTHVPYFQPQLDLIRLLSLAYVSSAAILSIVALAVHSIHRASPFGHFVFRLTGFLGAGEILYTPAALISIVAAYQTNPPTMIWLLLVWVGFLVIKPVERLFAALSTWSSEHKFDEASPGVGAIERVDHPNILRVQLSKSSEWKPGTLHIAAMPDGDQRFVLALFTQVQGSEVMGTGLCVASVGDRQNIDIGDVHCVHDQEKAAQFLETLSGSKGSELIGFTVEHSTIGMLKMEIASSTEVAEGDVIFARIRGQDVFYQIIEAETSEESFDQNPHGTCIARAAQLGCYDDAKGFTKYQWLPEMNSPIFWAKQRKFAAPKMGERDFVIGDVPSTNIGMVANIDELVEYHTAILGITGTGKTELALDVVREAIKRKVKVFCVDFTGEYRARLADLKPIFPSPSDQAIKDLEDKLFAAETGDYGGRKEKGILNTAIQKMRAEVTGEVAKFLEDNEPNLAIFELGEIANTTASLRLTELYLSAVMNWARANRKARQIMIVLEEAHTIIPETHGAGFDYDSQWVVSRIGQIALQGRKYGVGLLVVSQRTALVSKTILSQCNTFFTHSLIDQTSLTFLESVYSVQHVKSIPNLQFLECLAFGKALRTQRPILIKRAFDQEKKKASESLKQPLKKKEPEVREVEGISPQIEVAADEETAEPE